MILFLITAGAAFALCQFLRDKALKTAMPVELPSVRLQRTVNRAGAAGLGRRHPKLVTVCAGLALAGTFAAALWGGRRLHRSTLVGLGLMAGGGLSNLWERLRFGGVLDYIRFPRLPGKLGKLIYNPADFGIFAGALAVLWKELTK